MTKVLVIDDEAQIRRFLRAGFELHDYTVMEAENAALGLRSAMIERPDLIILDLNLPDLEGSEILERIRSWSNVPIIVLSIEANEQEKVRLLKLGADDYVIKPFGISELLARGEAALRRHLRSTNRDPIVRTGRLSIDLGSQLVTLNGKARPIDTQGVRTSSHPCDPRGTCDDASTTDQGDLGQPRRQYTILAYPGTQAATEDRIGSDTPVITHQRVGSRLSAFSGVHWIASQPRRNHLRVGD